MLHILRALTVQCYGTIYKLGNYKYNQPAASVYVYHYNTSFYNKEDFGVFTNSADPMRTQWTSQTICHYQPEVLLVQVIQDDLVKPTPNATSGFTGGV